MPDQRIVAVNGVLVSTLGYKAPVLTEQGEAWVLGGARRFPAADLPGLANEGLLTLLEQPIALSEVIQAANGTRREELGPEQLSLPCYVLYADVGDLNALETSIGISPDYSGQSTLAGIVNQLGKPVKFAGSALAIAGCALSSGELRTALQALYATVYRHLMDLLVSVHPDLFERHLQTTADKGARFLYQVAFDTKSAGRAISLRNVTLSHGSDPNLWMHWTRGAAKAWGLPGGDEAWAEQGRAMLLALRCRRIGRDASTMRESARDLLAILAGGSAGTLKYGARNAIDFRPLLRETNISLPKENPRHG